MSWLTRCVNPVIKFDQTVTLRLLSLSANSFSETTLKGTDFDVADEEEEVVRQPLVLEENHGDIALIGINRPEVRNCVNSATAVALREAFVRFEKDKGLKSAVFHGVGGNFCAGYDLSELAGTDEEAESEGETRLAEKMAEKARIDPMFRPMGPSKMFISKPVIGAISGYAVAGGLELALLCDIRILEETAIMGVFCRRFGVPLIDGGTVRLGTIIGYGRAMEMILTGRPVNAQEALAWGLANEVVPTGTALGKAFNFARSLKKFPQESLLSDRRSLFYSTHAATSFDDASDYEFRNGLPVLDSESQSGAQKFVKDKIGRGGSFDINELKKGRGTKEV